MNTVGEVSISVHPGFLSLGEASRLLGITPSTLRRWADRGQIPSFTTPGGHRRFPSEGILALLPQARPRRPSLGRLGVADDQISRTYQRLAAASEEGMGWLERAGAEDRRVLRQRGARMSELVLAFLDAESPSAALSHLDEACRLGEEYAGHLSRMGGRLEDAVESFLRFRAPFIESLADTARRRGLDIRESTGLLIDAAAAFDKILVCFIGGWGRA